MSLWKDNEERTLENCEKKAVKLWGMVGKAANDYCKLEAERREAVSNGEEWRLRWVEEESWRKGLELRLKNAIEFIENFEDSGEEHIWLSELKKVLEGSV